MSDYPRLLYRPGTQEKGVWGKYDVDLRIVDDVEAEASALSEGWTLRPDDEPLTVETIEAPHQRRGPGRPRRQEA